jgi:hypothetical protein
MDPTHAATQRFNQRLQEDMKRMVFADGCGAWYTDDEDVNFTLWPWSATRYVAEFARVRAKDFRLEHR